MQDEVFSDLGVAALRRRWVNIVVTSMIKTLFILLYPREHYCQKQKQKPGRISLRRHSSLHFKVGTEILLQYSTARCHL